MPLRINVGLSRKVGEANFGSRGASVNVEMELDSALVGDPGKLRERIRQIFGLVRTSLAEELNGSGQGTSQPTAQNGTNHGSTPPATAPGRSRNRSFAPSKPSSAGRRSIWAGCCTSGFSLPSRKICPFARPASSLTS